MNDLKNLTRFFLLNFNKDFVRNIKFEKKTLSIALWHIIILILDF